MTIECPICGKQVAFNQYSFDDEMCNHCLETENEEEDVDIDIDTLNRYII